ncbi:MAG TPA: diaminopropionate ammonia-lyase [Ktedonobacteraceae bacterium]|nr:diaminopropionate ammonia-lyase [Ktedonobacteraceae bacterium]
MTKQSGEVFYNPQHISGMQSGPINQRIAAFHRRLPGYNPTPLLEVPALASELQLGKVWVKDESQRFGLPSFKFLGASWASYQALEARNGQPFQPWQTIEELHRQLAHLLPLRLSAATEGNHGRAVAHFAAMLGLNARIYIPRNVSATRIEEIKQEGAEIIHVDGSYDQAVSQSAAEVDERTLLISDTSWAGYEVVPGWVIDGYQTMFQEIDRQLAQARAAPPDLVAVQMGVGALATAVIRHFQKSTTRHRTRIIGVEPIKAACVQAALQRGRWGSIPGPHSSIMPGLNCGTPSLIAWPDLSAGLEVSVTISDEQAEAAMQSCKQAGINSGASGAAGLAGIQALLTGPGASWARAHLDIQPHATLLLLNTEGSAE